MEKYKAQGEALKAKYGDDFEKPAPGNNFGLNIAEAGAVDEWYQSLMPEILAIQKRGMKDSSFRDIVESDVPYYGATGGGLSYTFTPTSLGTIITVKEAITGKELNVSDAVGWYFYG
jgi:hypothetical protein